MKRTHDQVKAEEEQQQKEEEEEEKREPTSKETSPKPPTLKKKRKKDSGEENAAYKKYLETIGKLLPTFHDSKIPGMVEAAAPDIIQDIIQSLGVSKDNAMVKMIPEGRIKKIVAGIIVDEVNLPVRNLILHYPHHYMQLRDVVMKVDSMRSDSISEELANLKPPGDGEQPFHEFVACMNNIMVKVVKRVASSIENKELIRGTNVVANAILDSIEIPRNIKSNICKHLSNYILTFTGKHIYSFFLEKNKLMNKATDKYIR